MNTAVTVVVCNPNGQKVGVEVLDGKLNIADLSELHKPITTKDIDPNMLVDLQRALVDAQATLRDAI
jgi:hypothetical protein